MKNFFDVDDKIFAILAIIIMSVSAMYFIPDRAYEVVLIGMGAVAGCAKGKN
jgi:hypothetical protein